MICLEKQKRAKIRAPWCAFLIRFSVSGTLQWKCTIVFVYVDINCEIAMESAVLLYIVVTLMLSSGARGQSFSRSCSTVNGETICEEQQNQGGMAAASSQAVSGGQNGNYQNAYAGAGDPNDWSSSQTQQGVPPPAGSFPGFGGFGFGGFGFPNFGGGPAAGGSGSSASQSAAGSGAGNQGGSQQGSSSSSFSSSGGGSNQGSYQQASSGPGTFTYTSTGNGEGGAYAGGASFASAGSGSYAGPVPQPPFMNSPMNPFTFNPFNFVFGRR